MKVMVFGVWDLLHVGHVRFLQKARDLGTMLVVGVPTDEVVLADKGQLPIIPLMQRTEMLEALRCVSQVIIYNDLDFIKPLEVVRPNILVVGGDWRGQERHRKAEAWVRLNDCQMVWLPRMPDVSTTSIRAAAQLGSLARP